MTLSVRNILMAAVAVATVALAANSAKAESKVNVPFDFVVAGKTVPAGQYSIQQDTFHNFVTLRSRNGEVGYTWILSPGNAAPTDSAVKLRFDQIAKKHALRSIQYGALTTRRLDKGADLLEHATMQTIAGQ